MSGLGIGAAGVMGIAFEVLAPPVQTTPSTNTSGGTLAAGTYRYLVTATNSAGETAVSNELSQVTTGSTSTVTVNWSAVTGATGYKIYRTAVNGTAGTELLLTTVGVVTSFVDTGALTPAGAQPASNSAYASGVYTAPVKYIPFMSESLKFVQNTTWRRPIRQSASVIGSVPGDVHVEGDIEIEAEEDIVPYFLYASRTSAVKSGSGNYTYTFTPSAVAIPARTLAITIDRDSGVVFGYVGCVVSSYKFTVNNGMLIFTATIMGRDEASQATPTPTWPTSTPFGAGMYSIEFPTGTPVTDTDTFEFNCEDNATSQFRLKSTGRGAQFLKYGERTCSLHASRDFQDRTDYDAFKAYTPQSVTITGTKGANNSISILVPVATKDTYEVAIANQGDLVRAVIVYQNVIDGTGKEYQIVVKTQENLN